MTKSHDMQNDPSSEGSTLVRAAQGVAWMGLAKFGRQGIILLAGLIVLSRLEPGDLGLVREALILTGLVSVLGQMGLPVALIQRRRLERNEASSAFWSILGAGLLAYGLLVCFAEPIARIYSESEGVIDPIEAETLARIHPWVCLSVLFAAIRAVPLALLKRDLDFRRILKADIAGAMLGAGAAVILALEGRGIWSLVFGCVIGEGVHAVSALLVSGFVPRPGFSLRATAGLLAVALPVLGAQVLDQVMRTLDDFLVGWKLDSHDIGIYSLVFFLVTIPQMGIGGLFSQVGLSAYSRIQGNDGKLREGFLLMTRAALCVSVPILVTLSIGAPALVATLAPLLKTEWAGAEVPLSIMAVMGLFNAAAGNPGVLWIAKGRADIRLYWFAAMTITVAVATLIGLQWGLVGVCVAMSIRSALFLPAPAFITRRLVGLPVRRYLGALAPYGIGAGGLYLIFWPLFRWKSLLGRPNPLLCLPDVAQVLLLATLTTVVYLLLLRLIQPGSWKEMGRVVRMVVTGQRIE